MTKYAKMIAAVVAAVLTALVAVLTDNVVTDLEWINVAIAGTTAAAVFAAPNVPGARYTKVILAALGAILVFLASAITDGLATAELLQLGVVALGALGVYGVENKENGINISNTGSVGNA